MTFSARDIFAALALLKKYYIYLLESFTDDHVTTICTLCELIPVNEGFFNEVLSMTDTKEANRRILNSLIRMLNSDNQLVGFCELVKSVMSIRKRFSLKIVEFETGKVIHKYACSVTMNCRKQFIVIQYKIFSLWVYDYGH